MMMEQVFDLITQQLKYDIFYSENELDIRKIMQMPRLKMKLTDVLDHVLQKRIHVSIRQQQHHHHPSGKTD
ncbi:MAG: hypothetical protein V8R91_16595 [Butyricimonas faecihominis]